MKINTSASSSKLDNLASRAFAKLRKNQFDLHSYLLSLDVTPTQKALLSALAYSLMSISMVLANKLILSTHNFDYPHILLLLQCVTSLSFVYFGRHLGLVEIDKLDRLKLLQWLPVNLFFLLMLLSGFYSLKLLSVPMLLVFKNSNNVLVTCGDWLFFNQPISKLIMI